MAAARKVQVFIDPRQSERSRVMLGANVRLPDGEAADATVTDLSRHGFRATIPADLIVGSTFRIELPVGSAAHASVVWVDGGEVGCVFVSPLFEDEVRLIADIWDRPVAPTEA